MHTTYLRVLSGLVALFLLNGCDQPEKQPNKLARPVKLITLAAANTTSIRQFPAQVKVSKSSNLSFRMTGELLELNVSPGQRVSKGDVIARIDNRDANSKLDSARSHLDLAKADLERMRYTLERGAVSQAQFDQAEDNWSEARAAFAQANEVLSHTQLFAPYDGVIARVPVDNRQIIRIQETIAVIQEPGQIDVVFYLPEQIVQRMPLRNGQLLGDEFAFDVYFGGSNEPYFAHLASYSTRTSDQSLAYEFTLTLPQPEDITLLDGMSANVKMDLNSLQAQGGNRVWHLPAGAISYSGEEPDQAQVWRYLSSESVKAVSVEVGRLTSNGLEVTGELSQGDQIVAVGAHRLTADTKVRPWIKEQGL